MRKVVLLSVTFMGILICGLAMASVGWSQPFLLNGTHWSEISYDAKVMYVKGVGNMADFECQTGALKQGPGLLSGLYPGERITGQEY